MKKMNKKGFTLIEMLVVIAIIAILVAIVIPVVSNATEKAKQATDLANIRSLVAQYQIDNLNGTATLADFTAFEPKSANATYTAPTDTNKVVTYVAPLLSDGNGANEHTYTWTLGDLVTETTTATTAPANPQG